MNRQINKQKFVFRSVHWRNWINATKIKISDNLPQDGIVDKSFRIIQHIPNVIKIRWDEIVIIILKVQLLLILHILSDPPKIALGEKHNFWEKPFETVIGSKMQMLSAKAKLSAAAPSRRRFEQASSTETADPVGCFVFQKILCWKSLIKVK